MSALFQTIEKTFAKVLDDLNTGVAVYGANDVPDRPSTGLWIEAEMISQENDGLDKTANDFNNGVYGIEVYTADRQTMTKALNDLCDTIANAFKHGVVYTHYDSQTVFIQRLTRVPGREVGAYFKSDLSVYWENRTTR